MSSTRTANAKFSLRLDFIFEPQAKFCPDKIVDPQHSARHPYLAEIERCSRNRWDYK